MTLPAQVGPYHLGEKIGEGGMGSVCRCTSEDTNGEELAIKLLPSIRVESEDDRNHFLQECRALERLQHPNILRLHDYGIIDGVAYLVTEFCADRAGRPFSLSAMLSKQSDGRLDARQINLLFPQICLALSYIHGLGMVHCDLKPENVLLEENEVGRIVVKLGDFGLASVTVDSEYIWKTVWEEQDPTAAVEVPGESFSGTYDYMSPEQFAGEPLDARSDIYSLGVMLYRVATGYDRITFVKPSTVSEDIPEWVDEVVSRCIAADKEDRCDNGLELLFLLPPELRPGKIERSVSY